MEDDTAEAEPGGKAEGVCRGEVAERPPPDLLRERDREKRRARCRDHRAPDPLQGTEQDEPEKTRRRTAEERARGEEGKPCNENVFLPHHIPKTPEGDQEPGDGKQVGYQDPGSLAGPHVEMPGDRGEGEDDDARVRGPHKGAEHDGSNDEASRGRFA